MFEIWLVSNIANYFVNPGHAFITRIVNFCFPAGFERGVHCRVKRMLINDIDETFMRSDVDDDFFWEKLLSLRFWNFHFNFTEVEVYGSCICAYFEIKRNFEWLVEFFFIIGGYPNFCFERRFCCYVGVIYSIVSVLIAFQTLRTTIIWIAIRMKDCVLLRRSMGTVSNLCNKNNLDWKVTLMADVRVTTLA